MSRKSSDSTSSRARSFNEHNLILKYFSEHPRKGIMLDVGAMLGTSFRAFMDLDWQIYAFEPDPGKDLKQQFAKHPKVHVFDFALSDEPESRVPFFSSPESQGVSTLKPFLTSHHEVAQVEVRTLSQVLRDEGLRKIDYLKIDTEGFDLKVLRGYPWHRTDIRFLDKRQWPEVILCEFDDRKSVQQGSDYHDLGRFLQELGYEVFLSEWSPIVKYGQPHAWVSICEYPCNLIDPKAWGNFIAVSRRGHPDTMRALILETVLADRATLRETLRHRDTALSNLKQLKDTMAARVTEIRHLKEAVEKRNRTIVGLKEALADKNDGLSRTRQALKDRNITIQHLREAVTSRDEKISELKQALAANGSTRSRWKASAKKLISPAGQGDRDNDES